MNVLDTVVKYLLVNLSCAVAVYAISKTAIGAHFVWLLYSDDECALQVTNNDLMRQKMIKFQTTVDSCVPQQMIKLFLSLSMVSIQLVASLERALQTFSLRSDVAFNRKLTPPSTFYSVSHKERTDGKRSYLIMRQLRTKSFRKSIENNC